MCSLFKYYVRKLWVGAEAEHVPILLIVGVRIEENLLM